MDSTTFKQIGYSLVNDIAAFIESLSNRKVTPGETPKEIREILGYEDVPNDGVGIDAVLQQAKELLFNHSLFNGHPKFWGYITSSPAPGGILADFLASAINANVGAHILSPMATEMERQTISWIAQLISLPKSYGGIFVSGGNMANFTGFLVARKTKTTWDISKTGQGHKRLLVYCSKGTHTWIHKAVDVCGIGTDNIRWIATDPHHKMSAFALEETIKEDLASGYLPLMVIATAGTVSTGAVDDLWEIGKICKKHNVWFHIDGAYGAPAAMLPELASSFKGMDMADSIALDPHKWLYSPLEAGCLLVKDINLLINTFNHHAAYYNFDGQPDDPPMNFLDAGLQNSRGFKALKVWTTIKQIGKSGYIRQLRDDIYLANYLYDLIQHNNELEAISCYLSIVTFRYNPKKSSSTNLNKLNEAIVNQIQTGGQVFLSHAIVGDHYCLRVCIVNFRTEKKHLEELISIVVNTGRALV